MSPVKIKEYIPVRLCSYDRLKRLRKAGIVTDGYERSLEEILTSKGFGLPSACEDGFGFTFEYKYIFICQTYADCLAEEILLLVKLGKL